MHLERSTWSLHPPGSSSFVPSLERTVLKSQASFQRESLHLLHRCVCACTRGHTHRSTLVLPRTVSLGRLLCSPV